ncbi:MAG: enoyl-CoA hydratase/isomerase family protein [Xanthobacteraceae bacterium]
MIELGYHADIAILRMAHGRANAMSTEFCRALTARLAELRTAPARAVILTGTGRIFSAGVDLPRLIEGGVPYVREFLPALNEMLAAVFSYSKPVVAAINGHAIAGGCVLACAADRRVMAKEAGRIGVTELLVGVPFPAAAMEIMRHATAPQYFEHAIFNGATFAPEEAMARGLVDEIVEPEQLQGRALSVAIALAALSPAAFALSKRQTRQPSLDRLERDGSRIDDEVMQIWCAHDTLDRIRDYVTRTLKKG